MKSTACLQSLRFVAKLCYSAVVFHMQTAHVWCLAEVAHCGLLTRSSFYSALNIMRPILDIVEKGDSSSTLEGAFCSCLMQSTVLVVFQHQIHIPSWLHACQMGGLRCVTQFAVIQGSDVINALC